MLTRPTETDRMRHDFGAENKCSGVQTTMPQFQQFQKNDGVAVWINVGAVDYVAAFEPVRPTPGDVTAVYLRHREEPLYVLGTLEETVSNLKHRPEALGYSG
jgi:hypothetical protein